MAEKIRVSFPDCPHKCNDGVLYNPYTGVKVPCPYCEEKRKEQVRNAQIKSDGKSVYEILKIERLLTGEDFNMTQLISEKYASSALEETSVAEVEKTLRELLSDVTIGEYPKRSLMFNFGSKAHSEYFIVPYMLKAYENGIKVAPLIDAIDLQRLRYSYENMEDSLFKDLSWGEDYKDYLTADIVFVRIDAGASKICVNTVKGLMQLRSYKSKPTFIVTDKWSYDVQALINEDETDCLNLATLISVKYKDNGFVDAKEENKPTLNNVSHLNRGTYNMTGSEYRKMLGK